MRVRRMRHVCIVKIRFVSISYTRARSTRGLTRPLRIRYSHVPFVLLIAQAPPGTAARGKRKEATNIKEAEAIISALRESNYDLRAKAEEAEEQVGSP